MERNILSKIIRLNDSRLDSIAIITLNRPKIANALNPEMIDEFVSELTKIEQMDFCRALLIRGNGKNFCAGADLNWMKESRKFNLDKNLLDAKCLLELFETLYRLPIPTIAITKGAVYGGAVGLVACCDIAIALKSTSFSMSEMRIGLVPAVIMPYLARKITSGKFRWYGLTGKTFSAEEAKACGLIEIVCDENELKSVVEKELKEILLSAPNAQKTFKKLYQNIIDNSMKQGMHTVQTLSEIRVGKEAREGLDAFLEKKEPPWSIKVDVIFNEEDL